MFRYPPKLYIITPFVVLDVIHKPLKRKKITSTDNLILRRLSRWPNRLKITYLLLWGHPSKCKWPLYILFLCMQGYSMLIHTVRLWSWSPAETLWYPSKKILLFYADQDQDCSQISIRAEESTNTDGATELSRLYADLQRNLVQEK